MRRLAELIAPVESETPFGGQAVSHEPLGWIWFRPERRRRREHSEAGARPVIETRTVEVRTDPRLEEGRVLRFDGGDWTVVAIDDARAGLRTLTLERRR